MVLENFIVDAPIVWDRVGKKIFENPHVKQGRKMRVQITNAGMVEDLSGYILALGWKHTVSGVDGLDVFEDSSEANVGIFEMAYTENLMTNLGNLKASLVLTSVEDMVAAEYAFARSGATLLQRANQDQVELNNGTIIAKQVTYQMVNGDIVMYASNHNAIRLVADILVASADTLPQMAPVTGAMRPQVIERQAETLPTDETVPSAALQQRAPAVTSRIERPTTNNQPTTNTTRTPSTSTPERQTVRTVTPSTNTPTNRATTDQARPAPAPAPSREEAAPAPAAPEGDSSITIVESNETY